jgi:hypothetical protein
VTGFSGTCLAQPATFCIRERFLAQRVLPDQASAIENLLYLVKPARSHDMATLLRYLPRQHDDESKSVLDISHLGLAYQPLPIKIVILDAQQRRSLDHADFDVARGHRRKEDGRGILGGYTDQLTETWIS